MVYFSPEALAKLKANFNSKYVLLFFLASAISLFTLQFLVNSRGGYLAITDENRTRPLNLQPQLDNWIKGVSGRTGVVIFDSTNYSVIASHQSNLKFPILSFRDLILGYEVASRISGSFYRSDDIVTGNIGYADCVKNLVQSESAECSKSLLERLNGAENLARITARRYGLKNTTADDTSAEDILTIMKFYHDPKRLNTSTTDLLKSALNPNQPPELKSIKSADKIQLYLRHIVSPAGSNLSSSHWLAVINLPRFDRRLIFVALSDSVSSDQFISLINQSLSVVPH